MFPLFLFLVRVWENLAIIVLCDKEPACQYRKLRNEGSIPRSGRSPGGGHGNPLQYSRPENPMDRGDWQAIVHCHLKAIIKHQKCPQPFPPRRFQKEPPGLGCVPDCEYPSCHWTVHLKWFKWLFWYVYFTTVFSKIPKKKERQAADTPNHPNAK